MIAGIFNLLSTAAAVSALAGTRVYPVLLPNDAAMPAVTYQVVGSQMQVEAFGALGIQRLRVQFDAWGTSYASAESVRAAIIATLNRFQGELNDGTYVQATELLQVIDQYEFEALQYRCISEFYLWAALATN